MQNYKKMSKLQLYIGESLPTYKDIANVNPSIDVKRYVGDYTHALGLVDYDTTQSHTFLYVKFLSAGYMVSIVETVAGKADHQLSVSIYVPYELIVSGDELTDMLSSTAEILRGGRLDSESTDSIRDIFCHDYPEDSTYGMRAPSEGREPAYVKYGGDKYPTLRAYASIGFYLPEFSQYEGILFVEDDEEGIESYHGKDLSAAELPELTVIEPPANPGQGFTPHIFRHIFNAPYVVPVGREIDIVWRRSGFENIVQKITVDGPDYVVPDIDAGDSTKSISPASFYITSQGSQDPLPDVTITVNGTEINKSVNFTYKELSNARVEITAPGYFAYSGRLDLASTTQALIQMRELHKVYRFDLPAHTPEPMDALHFTIHSKRKLDSSPIEGYTTADGEIAEGASRSNMLVYTGGQSRRSIVYILCALVGGLLAGLLAGWFVFGNHSDDDSGSAEAPAAVEAPTPTVAEPAAESPAAEEAPVAAAEPAPAAPTPAAAGTFDSNAAKAYLDSHTVWKRDEMAAIAGLEGLFDDMNTYNFDRITGYWNERLRGSRSFDAVVAAVRGSATKRNPRTDNHAPNYNSEGDTAINWRGYTYWVDP